MGAVSRAVHKPGRRVLRVKPTFSVHLQWGMRADIYRLKMLQLTVSGWVHRHQANVIAYLIEENRVPLGCSNATAARRSY